MLRAASFAPIRRNKWVVLLALLALGGALLWFLRAPRTRTGTDDGNYDGSPSAQRLLGAPAGVAAKLTRAPYIQWTTETSAHIVWNTDIAASTIVEWVRAGSKDKVMTLWNTLPQTRHIIKIPELRAGTVYNYRVGSNGRELASGKFATAKRAGQKFGFAVWGDSGTASPGQKALAKQIAAQNADFFLHTGDLVYSKGEAELYDSEFFAIYARDLVRAPFYGSLGNHDVGTNDGQPFLDNFVLPRNGPPLLPPERNYSFDYAGAHVVILDSTQTQEMMEKYVAPWLDADLASSKALWKFAVFHHPPFSSGKHGDEPRTQKVFAPIFARRKVDVVFNGHDHTYERYAPRDGVVYLVTGAGGAGLYKRKKTDSQTRSFNDAIHSLTRIDIHGRTLRGRQIAHDGAVIDDWGIKK